MFSDKATNTLAAYGIGLILIAIVVIPAWIMALGLYAVQKVRSWLGMRV